MPHIHVRYCQGCGLTGNKIETPRRKMAQRRIRQMHRFVPVHTLSLLTSWPATLHAEFHFGKANANRKARPDGLLPDFGFTADVVSILDRLVMLIGRSRFVTARPRPILLFCVDLPFPHTLESWLMHSAVIAKLAHHGQQITQLMAGHVDLCCGV